MFCLRFCSSFTCLFRFLSLEVLTIEINIWITDIGVSIVEGKHLVTSRTQKLSPLTAKVVHGRLCVRLARRTFYILKSPTYVGLFFAYFLIKVGYCNFAHGHISLIYEIEDIKSSFYYCRVSLCS